jgi:methyl-accepting chemotaxis protein
VNNASTGLHQIEMNGQTWLANVYLSPDLNWRFIGFMPTGEVYQEANSLITLILGVAVIMVLLFLTIGYALMNPSFRT